MDGRLNEAQKFMEEGHNFMKTSLLKWSPDYDNAANKYNQAAMAYKGYGSHQKAIEANELAIKCYLSTQGSGFQAAKCMEQAAQSARDLNDFDLSVKYFRRAVDIYRTIGQLDTAIGTLERAAKSFSSRMPQVAADFYIQASEFSTIEDRHRQSADLRSKAALIYVKAKEYKKAATIIISEINSYLETNDPRGSSRGPICLILVYLADDNIVGAMNVLKSYNLDDNVANLAHRLVDGFDKRDANLLKVILSDGFFNNLDNEYTKIARYLQATYGNQDNSTKNPDGPEPDDDDDRML